MCSERSSSSGVRKCMHLAWSAADPIHRLPSAPPRTVSCTPRLSPSHPVRTASSRRTRCSHRQSRSGEVSRRSRGSQGDCPTCSRNSSPPVRPSKHSFPGSARECGPLWTCSTLVVLHGPSTEPAVVDIESKLVEAGLASVLPADYRNFAHGRHNWLARHGDETAVLALASEADRAALCPDAPTSATRVPRAIIEFEGGVTLCSLASLITSLYLAGLAGETRGIDPGAPQVPEFGRKLYHLNAYSTRKAGEAARLEERARVAIERKSRMPSAELQRLEVYEEWRGSYDRFVSALCSARFHALVLDFDGTICERRNRFVGITEAMGTLLTRVLREDIVLGIASGRGKSVRDDLQRRIPRELWDRVVVGYYNGSDVGSLADDSLPDRSRPDSSDTRRARSAAPVRSTGTEAPHPARTSPDAGLDRCGGESRRDLEGSFRPPFDTGILLPPRRSLEPLDRRARPRDHQDERP